MHTESPNSVRLLLCERLEEFATDTNLRCHVPLQAWVAKAWGASKAHKPGRAVEYACHLGDFSVRRAFALTNSSGRVDSV